MKALSGSILIFSATVLFSIKTLLATIDTKNYADYAPYEGFLFNGLMIFLFILGIILIRLEFLAEQPSEEKEKQTQN